MRFCVSMTVMLLISMAALASEEHKVKSEVSSFETDYAVGMKDDVEEEAALGVRVIERYELKGNVTLDDITIISGKTLADSTKEAIRSVLESAGHASEVRFLDQGDVNGQPSSHQGSGGIRKIKVSSSIEDDVTD